MQKNNKEKVLIFWNGGKDSALALHLMAQSDQFEVVGLLSVLERESNRVRFHGVPDALLLEQAKMLKLPLQRIFVPLNCTNEDYIDQVGSILKIFAKKGITRLAFGDVHLEDKRMFKQRLLAGTGMQALFPLWQKNSSEIVQLFLENGFKALVTAVMKEKLGPEFLACEFNQQYIERLPAGTDPAGENGEFHTFVLFGPSFKMRVPFSKSIAVDEGPYLVSLLKEP